MNDENEVDNQSKDPLMDSAGPILKQLLENQRRWVKTDLANSSGIDNAAMLTHFNYDAIIAKVVNNWGIQNLVGVQPMSGPVGVVYNLEYTHQRPEGESKRLATLEVISTAVEARSTRISASWSLEAMQDMKYLHGANIEEEIYSALADEIAVEYCQEVIRDLINTSYQYTDDTKLENAQLVSCKFNVVRNSIAQLTRRGSGNWMIVGTSMLARLLDNTNIYSFIKNRELKLDGSALRHVGSLSGTCQVFYDPFMNNQKVLVGYKGKGSGETDGKIIIDDCGYVLCPYIGLMSGGGVVNPVTFEQTTCFMTRCGKMSFRDTVVENLDNENDNPLTITTKGPNKYYATITFSGLPVIAPDTDLEDVNVLLDELSRWDERKIQHAEVITEAIPGPEKDVSTPFASTRSYDAAMKDLLQQ